MPHYLTTNYISALEPVIEKAMEFHKEHHFFIVFIDLIAAFLSMDHYPQEQGSSKQLVNSQIQAL